MIDDDLSEEALENREVLAAKIREHQAEAAKAMLDVDRQYCDLKSWWETARPEVEQQARNNKMRMERADAVAIVMYNLAQHTATDIALMLASKVVDEEAAK
jgi:hypothetical protein